MFKKSLPIALCLLFSAAYASAQMRTTATNVNSEFLHQAEGGQFEVTPNLLATFGNLDYRLAGYSGDISGTDVGVTGEYGFNSMFSLGLDLRYLSSTSNLSCPIGITCSNPTSKGLANPTISLKFKTPAGPGTFKAGIDFQLSLTAETINTSGDSNQDTGGNTVTPFVAYEFPVGPGILGAKISYDIYKGDAKIQADQIGGGTINYTRTGGETFEGKVFYEASSGILTYGLALNYTSSMGTKLQPDGGITTSSNDDFSVLGLQAYLPIHVTPTITLLPTAIYGVDTYSSSYSLKSANVWAVGMGCRFIL